MTVTCTDAARRQWPTITLELLVAVAALYGGVGLVWDLVGDNAIGTTPDRLVGTPFTSWVLPGVFLLAVVAVPMGAAQVGWIAAQLAVMQRYVVLQPVVLAAGLAVLALALWAARHRPLVPPRSRR